MSHPYDYAVAQVVKVVDGDTVDLVVSVGFRWKSTQRFRLLGVDTPELNDRDPELRRRAQDAKAFVAAWLDDAATDGLELRAATYKGDAFGRWVVEVYAHDEAAGVERWLTRDLLEAGHADTWPRARIEAVRANAGDPGPDAPYGRTDTGRRIGAGSVLAEQESDR